ncbi:PilZ domain-containing protein [Rhodopseudomonas sp.]|uniref:PilZ domain-containing protein n=1 Tax=Rhodopseudomonas sp. TaxID=1078 RepID=UPI003B3B7B7E
MTTENIGTERVTFGRGYAVWIMGIDGTWRRSCVLKAVSSFEAELELEGSIEGLNLKEFFLLLSSTGLAYRRCELIRVNGSEIDVRFLKTKNRSGRPMGGRDDRMDS